MAAGYDNLRRMLSILVATMVAASTDVGAKWSWAYDDTVTAKLAPSGDLSFRLKPSLGKSTFDVEVLEAGERGWKKLRLTAKQGKASGRKWELQNNYGDVELRALTPSRADDINDEELVSARDAELNNTVLRAARLLLLPDAIVAASSGGACTPEVRAAMLKAITDTVARVSTQRGAQPDDVVGDVTCGEAGHYDVAFSTTDLVGADIALVTRWKGSVQTPAGALHATLKLSGTIDTTLELLRKKRRLTGRMTLSSAVVAKKR